MLPGLLPIVFSGQFLFGFNTMLVNAALLLLVYLVIGFGVVSLVRWTGRRFFAQLGASLSVLVRGAAAALLLPRDVLHDGDLAGVHVAGAGGLLDGDGAVRAARDGVPRGATAGVREVQSESAVGDVPLRRKERLNLAAVALISEMLQVVFVSTAIWLFYVVLGALLVNEEVRIVAADPRRRRPRDLVVR